MTFLDGFSLALTVALLAYLLWSLLHADRAR